MALVDSVTARVSAQRLIELTNHDERDATTINTTVLGLAADDAEQEFQQVVGQVFDEDDAGHVQAAVQGVVYYLLLYRATYTEEMGRAEERWRHLIEQLAKVRGRNRIVPASTSVLVPSDEQRDASESVRPDFDRENLDALVLKPPRRRVDLGRPGPEN